MVAQAMLDFGSLDEVWFVVSPQNPFKKSKNLLHEFDRMKMVELAIENNDRFRAIDIEFHMPRPSFTIDTLTHLSDKYRSHDFHLIIGEDNLISFPKWKNSTEILKHFGLLVYPRPGERVKSLPEGGKITMVEAPLLDISATYIRKCVRQDRSVKYLVPDTVAQFIYDRKLYTD